MNPLFQYLKNFLSQDEGQDLLEYALLIALIAIVCVGAITLAGGKVETAFNDIAAAI